MDAKRFLEALGAAMHGAGNPRWNGSPAQWTLYMLSRLLDAANANSLHMCARGIGRGNGHHMAQEFLFDITMYDQVRWVDWGQPSIIIEHENLWSDESFYADFWKLLVGFAPLRVMFGYANNEADVRTRAANLSQKGAASGWTYPSGVEDLVVLRSPDMNWPDWVVVHRPDGRGWSAPKVVTLDGSAVTL